MTAIAVRDGVIAADCGRWHGELCFSSARKIERLLDGSLLASAGGEAVIFALRDWLNAGQPPGDKPDLTDISQDGFVVLWLRPNGLYRFDGTLAYSEETAPFMAAGAHADFLMGAMAAGATAVGAVRLAVDHCAFARGPVQVETLLR